MPHRGKNGIPDVLETERLILRRYRMPDANTIPDMLNDWEVVRWLSRVPNPYTASDAQAWVARTTINWDCGIEYQFVIVPKADDGNEQRLVGAMGLTAENTRPGVWELGYWIAPVAWGRGLATEAARAVIDFGFTELLMDLVWATVLPENLRSRRVLEKTGMVADGYRSNHFLPIGRTVVCPHFSLMRENYLRTRNLDT
jgi:RimJ/RimL family protein N-acetyltransferase